MKALPKLSKAQQTAWARVLEWYEQGNDTPFTAYELRVHGGTLDALERKEMLKKHVSMFITVKPSYTIHPDYLPASEPDAAPVAEAATGKFVEGQRVYLPANKAFKDTNVPAYGTVQYVEDHTNSNGESFQRVWVQFDNIKRGLMEVHPDFLVIASTDGTVADDAVVEDERPTVTESRLIDTVNALRARVAELEAAFAEESTDLNSTAIREVVLRTQVTELEAENARLLVYLKAIREESESDLGEWLPVAIDMLPENIRAMKAIYEGARDAIEES